jgi:GAF domain-containing protein
VSGIGRVVSVSTVAEMGARWPAFVALAARAGYLSVHAIPLRLRGQVIGSLNLFREREGALNAADATAAQALADVATISVLQERTIRDSAIVHDQLRHALDSRVVIEQAKGVVAHTHGVDMDEAFRLIRRHARNTSTSMPTVAEGIVNRRIVLEAPRG